MIRSATAVWRGGPGAGEGTVSTSSGVIANALYSFSSGFGNEPCTNPGEMLAAAEASCICMMFAQELAGEHFAPHGIQTKAEMKIEEVNGRWTITHVHLDVSVQAPEMSPEQFKQIAEQAKANCPISRALKAEVTMDAKFVPMEVHAIV